MKNYSIIDQFIIQSDNALKTVLGKPNATQRNYPADGIDDCELSETERKHIAGLMRVNHAGEVSAQALYQGQSLTARDPKLAEKLKHASIEESDHLNWCRQRLHELDERPSLLDPLWYAGSFCIGMSAGIAGDRWNLGFLAETEHQVVRHLDNHLNRLPAGDCRSRAIVEQMKIDEQAHADLAENLGAAELPQPIKKAMRLTSRIMTALAERI